MAENLTFRGAVLTRCGAPLELIDGITVPALKDGQVLVKIRYSGVCHSQVMEARGHRGPDSYVPHLLGHEATGEVVQVGASVTKVAVGDMVVLGWIKGGGIEAGGTVYHSPIGKINSGGVTTFSEYTVASENRVVKLPPGMPLDVGVLLGCALPTGAGLVLNQLAPPPNSAIGVIGLGGIGLSALMALSLFEPKLVIAVDSEPAKLELAKRMGATHTILASEDVAARVKEITGGAGLDACVEAAGLAKTIELAFSLVRRNGGRCVFASHPASGEMIRLDPFELICGKSIEGSWGGASRPDSDVPRLASLYTDKQLPFGELLSHTYTLDDINQALDDLEAKRIVRALIAIAP